MQQTTGTEGVVDQAHSVFDSVEKSVAVVMRTMSPRSDDGLNKGRGGEQNPAVS